MLLFWWRHQSNKTLYPIKSPHLYTLTSLVPSCKLSFFSDEKIILAIRCYVQVVFPATPCHLMTLWKWKQQPVTRWLDSYITQNNKKDGTQPHDDDDNVVVVDALVFFSQSPSCDVTKTKWQMKLMISRLLMLGLLLLMILLPLEAS